MLNITYSPFFIFNNLLLETSSRYTKNMFLNTVLYTKGWIISTNHGFIILVLVFATFDS